MENLVHDFPLAIDFEECKEIGKAVAGPVVEFQSHRGNRLHEIDAGNSAFELSGCTILIVPVKELLDGPREQISSDVPKDGCVRMKSELHVGGMSRLAAIDVVLNRLRDRVIFTQTSRSVTADLCF